MASSWFKGLSSILSRRNNKKKVSLRQTSKLHRDLYLEPLETRLNPSNFDFQGGVINLYLSNDLNGTTFTINNSASNGQANNSSVTITTSSPNTWTNGTPAPGLPNQLAVGSFTNVGQTLTIITNDPTLAGLVNFNFTNVAAITPDVSLIVGSSTIDGIYLNNISPITRTAGNGYFTSPTTAGGTLTISGGSGTGAAATGLIGFNRDATYNITSTTTGTFNLGDTIAISGGGGATVVAAQAVITALGATPQFRILTPGSYTDLRPGTPFTITNLTVPGTGTFDASAQNAYGGLVSVNVTSGGTNYVNPIAVNIVTPTGAPAGFNFAASAGV